jgi:hypothetical protein
LFIVIENVNTSPLEAHVELTERDTSIPGNFVEVGNGVVAAVAVPTGGAVCTAVADHVGVAVPSKSTCCGNCAAKSGDITRTV